MPRVIKKYFDKPKQIKCTTCGDILEYTFKDLLYKKKRKTYTSYDNIVI